MLVPEQFGDGKKMYALDVNHMKSKVYTEFRSGWGGENNMVAYSFPAYFLSTKQSTKGSLSLGEIDLIFDCNWAMEVDGLDTYKNLELDEVLDLADNAKVDNGVPAKEISTKTKAIFGNKRIWSNGFTSDIQNKKLMEAWFTLPQVPEGMTDWFKFYKN